MAEGKEFSVLPDPTPDELREDGSGFAPRDVRSLSSSRPIPPLPSFAGRLEQAVKKLNNEHPSPEADPGRPSGPFGYLPLTPEKDRKDISDEPAIIEGYDPREADDGIYFT